MGCGGAGVFFWHSLVAVRGIEFGYSHTTMVAYSMLHPIAYRVMHKSKVYKILPY